VPCCVAVFDQKGDAPVKRKKVAEAKVKVAKAAAKQVCGAPSLLSVRLSWPHLLPCIDHTQALSWADEDDTGLNRSKALRIVVIRNMFHPSECQVSRPP
jgi:hypothetical protein